MSKPIYNEAIDIANDVRMFVDSVPYHSEHNATEQQKIALADERRFLVYAIKTFKSILVDNPRGLEVQFGCIVRNRLVRYMALAIKAEVNFNISNGVRLCAHLDGLIERLNINIAVKQA